MKPHFSGIPTDIFLILLIAFMIVLNVYAIFLAVLHIRRLHVQTQQQAQE
jgi:hypothetical protein